MGAPRDHASTRLVCGGALPIRLTSDHVSIHLLGCSVDESGVLDLLLGARPTVTQLPAALQQLRAIVKGYSCDPPLTNATEGRKYLLTRCWPTVQREAHGALIEVSEIVPRSPLSLRLADTYGSTSEWRPLPLVRKARRPVLAARCAGCASLRAVAGPQFSRL